MRIARSNNEPALRKSSTPQSPPKKSGWTPERRARQAARIRIWAPWAKSTGPKTTTGKAKSARNSYRHGASARPMRLLSKAFSAQSRFLRDVRMYVRTRERNPANELLGKWDKRLANEGRAVTAMLRSALSGCSFMKDET